jgi:type IV secretory pathway TrbF-like protein
VVRLTLEHFQVKWTRFTVENAAKSTTRADSTQVEAAPEHFQVKWTRFTVENAAKTKTRADSTQVETALRLEWTVQPGAVPISTKVVGPGASPIAWMVC